MKSRSFVERLHSKLMALYDEREELQLDIEMANGREIAVLEDQLHDLNHSIQEIEKQIREEESEHLSYMKEAI
jgi:predicted  nucleic acid-binding Zn-ribbon protein|tara:strand:- start:360 stop:578 length:219 start_codon:yes stop_codon:yes gene_type:complete